MKIESVSTTGINGDTVNVGHFIAKNIAVMQFSDIDIEIGNRYTLHGYIKSNDECDIICLGESFQSKTTWTEFATTIVPTEKRLVLHFPKSEYWFYNWKLEKGNLVTPWTPSPLDAKNDIEERYSEWKQTAEEIFSNIHSVSNDLSIFDNEWRQTANGLSAEISEKIDSEQAQLLIDATAKTLRLEIANRTTKEDVSTLIEASADTIRLKTGTLTWTAENSSLSEDGTFRCANGYFSGDITGSTGVFSGNVKAKTVEIGSTELTQIGSLGLAATTFTLDGERAIIKEYANMEDGGAGGVYYDAVSIGTIGCVLENDENSHASCELIGESFRQSSASGHIRLSTSYLRVYPNLVKMYSDEDINLSAERISFNDTNWDDFVAMHPYDWSTFSTEDNTNTWMPVVNGGRIYHRAVAATMRQANYWMSGSNRISCIRLSNDIVVYFVKATTPTTVDITTSAAKGYCSREYTWGMPNSIKSILYASSYVENNATWENVELKIHSISSDSIKAHFWCQNSYSGLPLYWYYVLVAQM